VCHHVIASLIEIARSARYVVGMEVSIIVPFSDARQFIEACACALISVAGEVREAEIIFADAGSRDGSSAILATRFPDLRVVASSSRNPYVARNAAARIARGKMLAFTDADCAVAPGWLRAVGDAAASGADFVSGPVVPPSDAAPLLQHVHAYENQRMMRMCNEGSGSIGYAYTNNLAVRASVFQTLGGFKEDRERGADSELVLRALSCGVARSMAYREEMGVVHLEVNSLRQWWRKKFLYGRSATARAMRLPDQARSMQHGISGIRLPVALLVGRALFEAGRLAALIRKH